MLDIVGLLDVCNVTGDSQMAEMARKLDDTLRGVTPDGLRNNEGFRAETKRAVDDVLRQVQPKAGHGLLPSLEM